MKPIMLDIQNVSLKIPSIEKPILSNLNYQVREGDFIVILGSNGSGKSSLLKLIDGRYHKTSGQIILNNKPLSDYPKKEFTHCVKTLTQNFHESLFTTLTILENYLLVKQNYEPNLFSIHNKSERLFLKEYLLKFNANLSAKLDQVVDRLSGGEKQALALALTVLYPPKVLLLDEHTSALDPLASEKIMSLTYKIAKEFNITCLLTTHDLSVAEQYGNRIIALRQGLIHQSLEGFDRTNANQHSLLAACY